MSVDQIVQLVIYLGFPSVCLVVLGKWVGRRIEKSDEDSRDRERQCLEREDRMGAKIDELENNMRELEAYMREQLVGTIKDNKVCMEQNYKAMEACIAATTAMTKAYKEK